MNAFLATTFDWLVLPRQIFIEGTTTNHPLKDGWSHQTSSGETVWRRRWWQFWNAKERCEPWSKGVFWKKASHREFPLPYVDAPQENTADPLFALLEAHTDNDKCVFDERGMFCPGRGVFVCDPEILAPLIGDGLLIQGPNGHFVLTELGRQRLARGVRIEGPNPLTEA